VSLAEMLMPHGAAWAFFWFKRLRALGLGTTRAAFGAFSTELRVSVGASRVEQLPPRLRRAIPLLVDAGANAGQWLVALSRLVPIARAEVFEPQPEVFRELATNCAGRPWARLHNVALGDRVGSITLHVLRNSLFSSAAQPLPSLASRYSARETEIIQDVQVPVVTLDSVIASDIVVDLLKIDVQGFERHVLAGAATTLSRTRVVLIEGAFFPHYDGDDTFSALHEHLTRDLGFELWDMATPTRDGGGRPLWTDMVFINRELKAFD
jgi:FkbM family methyltransferase